MFCECRDIQVRYGRTVVLAVERLTLPSGQITAIVGPNGAGKTTLLEILSLLRRPTRGQVRLWGRPGRPGDRDVQRKIVMVMHPGYLFRGSVWRNVLYGLRARRTARDEARTRAVNALGMVGMSDFAHRNVADLSAGERQRVNLARAIAIGPQGLLLDEPVANVDTRNIALIRDLLARLRDEKGTTIVHTSPGNGLLHDIADRVVHIEAGRVVSSDARANAGEATTGDADRLVEGPAGVGP